MNMGIIEQLRSDAEDHIGVAYACDCNPEDTINWRHAETAHEAANEIEQLRAKVAELESQASPASVPEGYVVVPVEPTMEMCEAGWNEYDLQDHFSVRFMYERMLVVAPTPPVSEDRWQSIETAPKDGSKFLAWRRHSTSPLIVFYNAEYDQYECEDGHLVFSLTHWMPLPKAPAMQEDKL